MSRIVEIGVNNLFGHLNYRIPLNITDNITIIHGPNGCGKTWILQLIKAVFSLNYTTLISAPFNEMEFKFKDGGHFSVRKHSEDHPSSYQASFNYPRPDTRQNKLIFTYSSRRTKKQKEYSISSARSIESIERQFPLSMIETEIPQLDRLAAGEWYDNSRGEVLTLEDIFRIYAYRLPRVSGYEPSPKWLSDITQRVHVNFIQSQRLLRVPIAQSIRVSPSRPSRKDITKMVEYDSKELADRISTTLAQSVKIAQSKDRTFPTRLLGSDLPQIESETDLREALNKIDAKRGQLYSAGLLDEEASVPLPSKAMTPMEKSVLSLYLQDVEEKLRVFDDLQEKITTFMDLINSKFKSQGKSLIIDRDQGFLFQNDAVRVQRFRPAQLSSGEQQQLVLFYELLFKTSNKSLVLIDEPEISLDVAWQRRFLDDLVKVIQLGGCSILMATHSPQIIHNRRDLAVPLSGGVKD